MLRNKATVVAEEIIRCPDILRWAFAAYRRKNWKEAHGFKGRLKIVYADGPSKGVLGRIVQFCGAEPSSD
jgi:hypothetical protein